MLYRFSVMWCFGLFFLVCCAPLSAWAEDAAKPGFVTTYPVLEKLKKVSISRIRVAGKVADPEKTKVTVNSRSTGVYSSGAFVDMVDLEEGKNTIRISSLTDDREYTRTYDIERRPAEKTLPASPLTAQRFKQPSNDITLWRSGDISFLVKGSTRAKVSLLFKDGDDVKSVSLSELEGGVGGIYAATIRFVPGDQRQVFDVVAEFVSGQEKVELEAGFKITVEASDSRAVATTKQDARIRTAYNGTFLCFPPAGVRMRVLEKQNSRFCVELTPGVEGWIDASSVSVDENGTASFSSSLLRKITCERPAGHDKLFFRLERPLAFDSLYQPDLDRIVVRIYNCFSKLNWIDIPEEDSAISAVEWEQNAGVLKLFVKLKRKINGHLFDFQSNNLVLSIMERKKTPPFVFVLDAGHGDQDTGAIGPAGTFEKDHVLEICKLAAKRFEGIKDVDCVLTRSTDKFIELAGRVEKAIDAGGDVFVSMHLNSVSLMVNPITRRGSNIFYTRALSKPLAESINEAFGSVPVPSNGLVCADFHVTRQQGMPAVLVEGCFLSNPVEEVKVLTSEVKQAMADAIVQGVCNYLGVDAGLDAGKQQPEEVGESK